MLRAASLLIALASSLCACGGRGVLDASGDASTSSGGRVPLNHRPDDAACSATPPPGNCSSPVCSDSRCADAGLNGRCASSSGGAPSCACTYDACTHDRDCAAGHTCACHGSSYVGGLGNTCVPGNCRIDSDCGPGGYCSPSDTGACGNVGGYFCHTRADRCVDDSDCSMAGWVCAYSISDGAWECGPKDLCW